MPKRQENGKQESKVKNIVEGLHYTQYPIKDVPERNKRKKQSEKNQINYLRDFQST